MIGSKIWHLILSLSEAKGKSIVFVGALRELYEFALLFDWFMLLSLYLLVRRNLQKFYCVEIKASLSNLIFCVTETYTPPYP